MIPRQKTFSVCILKRQDNPSMKPRNCFPCLQKRMSLTRERWDTLRSPRVCIRLSPTKKQLITHFHPKPVRISTQIFLSQQVLKTHSSIFLLFILFLCSFLSCISFTINCIRFTFEFTHLTMHFFSSCFMLIFTNCNSLIIISSETS